MATQKKVNYLNNKDILKEIHKSKMSFCWILNDNYHMWDIILDDVADINSTALAQAKENKSQRLQAEGYATAMLAHGTGDYRNKPKQKEFAVDVNDIPDDEVVFRVMTYEHIPLEPGRKKNPKQQADHHTRCNFPPFQHFRFNDKDELIIVGKSHWEGGMENGYFNKDHGKINNNLAKMFMKLCERYATRSNWRGYTYNDEMRSTALLQLSQIGLQFDESKSQNPFAYYTAAITNSFTRVLNLEKRNQIIRDDILEEAGLNPSYTRQTENEIKSGKLDFTKGNGPVIKYTPEEWAKKMKTSKVSQKKT